MNNFVSSRTPDGQRLKMMKNINYEQGRLQCLCNEVNMKLLFITR